MIFDVPPFCYIDTSHIFILLSRSQYLIFIEAHLMIDREKEERILLRERNRSKRAIRSFYSSQIIKTIYNHIIS